MFVSSVIDWRPVKAVPWLLPSYSWNWLQHSVTLNSKRCKEYWWIWWSKLLDKLKCWPDDGISWGIIKLSSSWNHIYQFSMLNHPVVVSKSIEDDPDTVDESEQLRRCWVSMSKFFLNDKILICILQNIRFIQLTISCHHAIMYLFLNRVDVIYTHAESRHKSYLIINA